jgi:phosphatidylglycerophosphate synthase
VEVKKYGDRNVIDLSEWGRPIARVIARFLKEKPVSVIQVTNLHFLLTLYSAWLILQGQTILACFLLIVKGVIDAVDGELARIRERPSHVGRYWDTVADTIGLIAVIGAFGTLFAWELWLTCALILATLFQYSLFNHYSILMRTMGTGDATSRVDERIRPIAYPWERQAAVNFFHSLYLVFFSWQDRIIAVLAGNGSEDLKFELTVSSCLGFGMQSLLIFALAVSENLELLPELILGVNIAMMVLVFVRSRL